MWGLLSTPLYGTGRLSRIRLFARLIIYTSLSTYDFLLWNPFPLISVTVYGSDLPMGYCLAPPPSPYWHYPTALVLCSCPTTCITSSPSVSCLIYRSTLVFTDNTGSPQLTQCHCVAWLTPNPAMLCGISP